MKLKQIDSEELFKHQIVKNDDHEAGETSSGGLDTSLVAYNPFIVTPLTYVSDNVSEQRKNVFTDLVLEYCSSIRLPRMMIMKQEPHLVVNLAPV